MGRGRGGSALGLCLALMGAVAGCGGAAAAAGGTGAGGSSVRDASVEEPPRAVPNDRPAVPDAGTASVIAAAGDISCKGCAQAKTAALLAELAASKALAAILPLGDLAYAHGTLADLQASYATSWGVPGLLALTHPVPGNHEYSESPGDGYFDYFDGVGAAVGIAGARGEGYYSFDLGSWHLVALNSNDGCRDVSCDYGSPQQTWLAADLAAHPSACALAYWHHPRYEGGTESGETKAVGPLWETFYDAGGDVVLAAHEHNYQQLAPLDRAGNADPAGMRSFVVGTGGAGYHDVFGGPHEGAVEVRVTDTHGVLELTLRDGGYDWRFVTVDGVVPAGASGTARCR